MKKIDFPVSALRICIDEMTPGDSSHLVGRIVGVGLAEAYDFTNSYALFLLIDKLLDKIGRPQAARKLRSFGEQEESSKSTYIGNPPRFHTGEEIVAVQGRLRTRDVYFISRMHSTWQGFIKDDAGDLIGNFESDLDFLSLLLKDRNLSDNDEQEA